MSQLKNRVRLVGVGLILIFLFLAIFLAACQGAVGPAGTPGATGPQGPAGATAPVLPGPGVKATISKVEVAADRKVTVAFEVSDAAGIPLRLEDFSGDFFGLAAFSWIAVDEATGITGYQAYTVAEAKGAPYVFGGKTKEPVLASVVRPMFVERLSRANVTQVSPGVFRYTLTTVLPEGYKASATHTVGLSLKRTPGQDAVNTTYSFVPAGGEVKVTRQMVAINSCNQCHDPLAFHGGWMRDTKMCVLCHTSQHVDVETGRTLELKNMVHKIHRGVNLPSVKAGEPFFIVGARQTVFDFGKIGWPQDIRNCTTCHGAPPVGMKAEDWAKIVPPNADNWKTAPSAAACGACHDNIDFATGKARYGGRDHPEAGAQKDDTRCSSCHEADSGKEFDASVVGAHVIPVRSTQLKGVNFTLEKAVIGVDRKPQVVFFIKDNAGKFLSPNDFNSLAIILGHPTTDYAHTLSETVNSIPTPPATFTRAGVLTSVGDGRWVYTFADALDSTWTGSVGIGINGYISVTIKGNEGKDVIVRESNVNPVIYASLDGSPVVPRRTVVKRENCNQCHLDLGSPAGISLHGGIRRTTALCLLCHNPNMNDEGRRAARRPPGPMPPESMQYKFLIHSIHAGDERAVPTWFASATKTEETFFPGDLKNCSKCHAGQSYTIPLPSGVLPATVTQGGEVVSVTQPITAACKACHIGRPGFDAHTTTMTATFGEACAVCHGRGRDFAVEKVHQR